MGNFLLKDYYLFHPRIYYSLYKTFYVLINSLHKLALA